MKKQLLLLLVGAFGCLFTAVYPLSAQTWVLTSAPAKEWTSIACSADGSKLVATIHVGGIYTSANSGATWTQTSAPTKEWTSIACSADGSKLVATIHVGGIYTSTNSGATWETNAANAYWTCVASSADGTKLAAVSQVGGGVYISTNSGATWNDRSGGMVFPALPMFDSLYGFAVCMSADGTKLVVAENIYDIEILNFDYGLIYTSTNLGATWNAGYESGSSEYWSSVACSADGSRLVAAANGGGIYTSTNSGAAWTLTGAPSLKWHSIASSADGSKLVAAATNSIHSIYTSTDSGATWTQATNGPSGAVYTSVASSADGSKLVAAVNGGGIYTSQTTPAPVLNIARSSSNFAFSWVMPSTNFVLQRSSNLGTANWTGVTNTPTLNLTNLQNQVALPLPAGNAFYRLKTP